MPKAILAATTGADQSDEVIADVLRLPVVFRCPGLAGAEVGQLQYKDSAGSWHDYYKDGSLEQCTATNTDATAYGPGIYRIDKDATVASVPVDMSDSLYP